MKSAERRSIKLRNSARNRFEKKTLLFEDLKIYMEKKAYEQKIKRRAQREYWHQYCKKISRSTDISTVWKNVKGIQNTQPRNIPTITRERSETPITNALHKANTFMEVFL